MGVWVCLLSLCVLQGQSLWVWYGGAKGWCPCADTVCVLCVWVCVFVLVWRSLCMLLRKRWWVIVCLCCVRVCCVDHVCGIARAGPNVDASARVLVWVLWLCVCVCVCPFVYVCKKKSMGVCVCLLCMSVLWGPSLWVCYGGAKGWCLCRRHSVCALCLSVCVLH